MNTYNIFPSLFIKTCVYRSRNVIVVVAFLCPLAVVPHNVVLNLHYGSLLISNL